MSTYDDRLAALEACTGGETVTVPAGWTLPREHPREYPGDPRSPRPGDVYTHDGGDDSIPWAQSRPGIGTGIIRYVPGSLVAAFGLTVDIDEAGLDVDATPAADTAEAPAPDASTVIVEDLAAADTPAPSPREEMYALRRSVDEANARAAAAEREAVVESVHADMRHRAQALEHAHRIADGDLEIVEVVMLAEWILGGDR